MLGSRIFVAVVFALFAFTFIYPTVVLYNEFGADLGHALATLYSHTFLYFSTFGVVALAAFYIPAVVFVDLYWNYVSHGRLRFILGTIVVVLLSLALAEVMFGILPEKPSSAGAAATQPREPALFELSPATLNAANMDWSRCTAKGAADGPAVAGETNPASLALCRLQRATRLNVSVSSLIRDCPAAETSDFLDLQGASDNRYCFASGGKADSASCCQAQGDFRRRLADDYASEVSHSATVRAQIVTLPFKVYFMLVVLIIGVMLASWRKQIDEHYGFCLKRLENGVLIGATAMLFWPICNQSFLQSAAALFGTQNGSVYQAVLGPAFSIVFGIWALLILFFFFRHFESDVEQWVRMLGGLASLIAVLNYDRIVDFAIGLTGAGASSLTYPLLMLGGLGLYASSFLWPDRMQPTRMLTRRKKKTLAADDKGTAGDH